MALIFYRVDRVWVLASSLVLADVEPLFSAALICSLLIGYRNLINSVLQPIATLIMKWTNHRMGTIRNVNKGQLARTRARIVTYRRCDPL